MAYPASTTVAAGEGSITLTPTASDAPGLLAIQEVTDG